MKKVIKLAIEGGYSWWHSKYPELKETKEEIAYFLLEDYEKPSYADLTSDPLFWQCLGKSLGWSEKSGLFREPGHFELTEWWTRWHSFIDHLAEGKDIESFFEELLK